MASAKQLLKRLEATLRGSVYVRANEAVAGFEAIQEYVVRSPRRTGCTETPIT